MTHCHEKQCKRRYSGTERQLAARATDLGCVSAYLLLILVTSLPCHLPVTSSLSIVQKLPAHDKMPLFTLTREHFLCVGIGIGARAGVGS